MCDDLDDCVFSGLPRAHSTLCSAKLVVHPRLVGALAHELAHALLVACELGALDLGLLLEARRLPRQVLEFLEHLAHDLGLLLEMARLDREQLLAPLEGMAELLVGEDSAGHLEGLEEKGRGLEGEDSDDSSAARRLDKSRLRLGCGG